MSHTAQFHLSQPTAEERHEQQLINSSEWRGALSLDAYIRREVFLDGQRFTKDGGLTPWALISGEGASRKVLASCESYRKRALVARGGKVEEVICHGVASVYCPVEARGKGYAGQMIKMLGERLEEWQADREECLFTVLYSDIGKKFYTARGWHPFASAHIALHPTGQPRTDSSVPSTRPLYASDLAELCKADEDLLRARLQRAANQHKPTVAVVPDEQTIEWHYARETFVGNELYGKTPEIKGAMVGSEPGRRVWCWWSKYWYNTDPGNPKGNTMHILRLVVEDPEYADLPAANEEAVAKVQDSYVAKATTALLAAAQLEASKWTMGEVEIWNPSSITLAAARFLEPSAKIVHRDAESIASLRWYGEGSEVPIDAVEWIANEKFSWC